MTDPQTLPMRTRDYQGHMLDSRRWDRFEPRRGDIVIATSIKAGTTWMQTIVANLIFAGETIPGPIMDLSPWLEMPLEPLDDILATLEAQRHRRFIKSHLALDGLRFLAEAKYIHVARDPRDVFMSLWNHHRDYSDEALAEMKSKGDKIAMPWPDCPADIKEFWRGWIGRSWFPWEHSGYPYWSCFHHLASWWDYRHLPNVLFVHYNDLLADLDGQMRRIAGFLEITVPESAWPEVVNAATFDTMRKNAEGIMGDKTGYFKGAAKTFINKGTNGRWRDVLDDADVADYRAAMDRVLDAEATAWMENGSGLPAL